VQPGMRIAHRLQWWDTSMIYPAEQPVQTDEVVHVKH